MYIKNVVFVNLTYLKLVTHIQNEIIYFPRNKKEKNHVKYLVGVALLFIKGNQIFLLIEQGPLLLVI